MELVGFESHNHASCIQDSLEKARAYCDQNKLQLTPVRQRVLEILLERHAAMGAYEILDVLREEGLGSQPPVAYRALDFLVSNGFVHKIERLNAFTACASPGTNHSPAFLVCQSCDGVAETSTHTDLGQMASAAEQAGFRVDQVVVEIMGECRKCQDASTSTN